MRGKGGREGAVGLEEGTQCICKFFEGLLRHPVLTPKTVGAALVNVFAVILPVEATTLLSLMLLLISEAIIVYVTLDVTAATSTTASSGDGSKHPVGVNLVVGSPPPSRGGGSGRSGALPAVGHGTDSHSRDPWPNIALRSVPHA